MVAHAQTVLARARLGNNTEDIETIRSGLYAGQIAIMDGYDVLGLPAMGHGHGGVHKLFDISRLVGLTGGPRGIAYAESERSFVFDDINIPNVLWFTDEVGTPKSPRLVTRLGDDPVAVEALNYIPRGSAFYPDRLAQVTFTTFFTETIDIMRLDGTVEAQIIPDDEIQAHGFGGFSFVGPNRLLIGTYDKLLYETDLSGHVVAGPIAVEGRPDSLEGVGSTVDGRIMAASYTEGKLRYFDHNLNRLPGADQDFKIGIGLSRPLGPGFDSDTGELLFKDEISSFPDILLFSVPQSLGSKTLVKNLADDGYDFSRLRPGMAYLPDEHRIAVPARNPGAMLLYDNAGVLEDNVDLSAFPTSPLVCDYLPSFAQFAIMFNGFAHFGQVSFVTRTGALVRTIDLRPLGVFFCSFAAFDPSDPSGGRLLVIDPFNDAIVVDLDGALLYRFEYRGPLNIPFGSFLVTSITSGPYAGAFATVQGDNSEVVIFTLP
ncbi:MAG: hypothetical protein HYR64_06470 [Fimbriimonas ginsengisoli]|uniref:Uncharacterized protein n=1 Tax=Fimbriimonas ginsengisoli TaxID=1005039 RepID=A0A931PTU5_FIMGI|nr:hypothetical protein [Fimbriimonas ginsengisoli]